MSASDGDRHQQSALCENLVLSLVGTVCCCGAWVMDNDKQALAWFCEHKAGESSCTLEPGYQQPCWKDLETQWKGAGASVFLMH